MQKQAITPVDNAMRTLVADRSAAGQGSRRPQQRGDDSAPGVPAGSTTATRASARRITRMLDDQRNFKIDNPDAQKQMEDMLARLGVIRDQHLGPAEQGLTRATKSLDAKNTSPPDPSRRRGVRAVSPAGRGRSGRVETCRRRRRDASPARVEVERGTARQSQDQPPADARSSARVPAKSEASKGSNRRARHRRASNQKGEASKGSSQKGEASKGSNQKGDASKGSNEPARSPEAARSPKLHRPRRPSRARTPLSSRWPRRRRTRRRSPTSFRRCSTA